MKAYSYYYGGKYIGETEADLCQVTEKKRAAQRARKLEPGEKEIPAVYIFPARSTHLPPPPHKEGFEQIFDGTKWNLVKIKEEKKEEEDEPQNHPEKEKIEKREKVKQDLQKIDVDSLDLDQMKTVLKGLLTLVAPKD